MNTAFVEYNSRRTNNTSLSNFIHPDDIIGNMYYSYMIDVELNIAFAKQGIEPIDLSKYDEYISKFINITIRTMADE